MSTIEDVKAILPLYDNSIKAVSSIRDYANAYASFIKQFSAVIVTSNAKLFTDLLNLNLNKTFGLTDVLQKQFEIQTRAPFLVTSSPPTTDLQKLALYDIVKSIIEDSFVPGKGEEYTKIEIINPLDETTYLTSLKQALKLKDDAFIIEMKIEYYFNLLFPDASNMDIAILNQITVLLNQILKKRHENPKKFFGSISELFGQKNVIDNSDAYAAELFTKKNELEWMKKYSRLLRNAQKKITDYEAKKYENVMSNLFRPNDDTSLLDEWKKNENIALKKKIYWTRKFKEFLEQYVKDLDDSTKTKKAPIIKETDGIALLWRRLSKPGGTGVYSIAIAGSIPVSCAPHIALQPFGAQIAANFKILVNSVAPFDITVTAPGSTTFIYNIDVSNQKTDDAHMIITPEKITVFVDNGYIRMVIIALDPITYLPIEQTRIISKGKSTTPKSGGGPPTGGGSPQPNPNAPQVQGGTGSSAATIYLAFKTFPNEAIDKENFKIANNQAEAKLSSMIETDLSSIVDEESFEDVADIGVPVETALTDDEADTIFVLKSEEWSDF